MPQAGLPMPRSPTLITLVLLTMSTALSLNMFLPALPAMAIAFNVNYSTISLSIGGYLAITAVLALVIGPLSDRIGRRPVVLGMTVIFTGASIAAALVQDITWFLVARFCQGVMVGGFILGSSIVRDTRSEKDVAPMLSTITAIMALAPIVAPIVGGLVVETLGWRAVFWLYAIIGLGLALLSLLDVTETCPKLQNQDRPPAKDLLIRPRFWVLVGTIACANSGFYVFLAGIPIVAAAAFGLSASAMGFALSSITVGFLFGSTAGRWISKAKGARDTLLLGRIIALAGLTAGLISTSLWPDQTWALLGATVFIGMGNGMTVPSTNALIMSLNPKLAGTAMGFSGSSVVGTGAFFTLVTAAILDITPTAFALVAVLWCLTCLSLVLASIERRF